MGLKCSVNIEVDKWFEQGLIDKDDAIDDYYLNGLKTFNEPVKIVNPEWNDWLAENQHLVGPTFFEDLDGFASINRRMKKSA